MTECHFTLELSDFSPLARGADFSASLVLGGDHSLYEFAEFLIKTVGFHFDHPFEFCDNLDNPYHSKERYTLFADMGEGEGEPGVNKTSVSQVFRLGRKMMFHFDYGDDWFFPVTCTAVQESEKKRRFKKVLSTAGTPPEQYPDPDA